MSLGAGRSLISFLALLLGVVLAGPLLEDRAGIPIGARAIAGPIDPVQEGDDAAGADDFELEDLLIEAEEARLDGDFRVAIERFRKVLERQPGMRDALEGLADSLRLIGEHDELGEVLSQLAKAYPDDLDVVCARGEYLFSVGRDDEAEAMYRLAIEKEPAQYRARIGLGRLLAYRGLRDESMREYRVLANHAASNYVEDAERLAWLGQAYWALGGFEEAAEVFSEAMTADRLHVPARLGLGDLFLDKYQTGDALREYKLALQISPNHPYLVYGLARAYFARERSFSALKELERVIAINPHHADALARMGRVMLEDRRFDEGREYLERALESHPGHKDALSLMAVHAKITNDPKRYESYKKRVLAIDAKYARLPLLTAEVLGGLYRFADGLPFAEEAIRIEPDLWRAYDVAGRFAFNIGEHDKGLAFLEKAQKEDNFRYPWRLNMIEVATIFDEFVARSNDHFDLYIHVDENEVMRGYLTDLLERCYDDLTRRYKSMPVGTTIVEVYPDQDDFAVRNIGATGIDLILGICFGRVITLNSPLAKPPGFFSWAQTAWHEFAHVLTLQITRARIPRWLTEGISVYEERRANPIWERRQEQELLNAYHNKKIFPLREINGAFRTPRIGFAYYQGSLLVEFIEKEWGFDAVLEILRLYAEDMSTIEILLEVLQLDADQFDERFLEFVREKIERFRVIPQWDRDRLEEFREEAEIDPDNAELHAKVAWSYYFQGGGVDCEAALGRALEADEQNAMANLLRGVLAYDRDRFETAERFLKRGLEGGAEDSFARLRLAQIYEKTGKIDEAIREYKRSKRDFPFYVGPGNPYTRLEAIYRARKMEDEAVRELRALADLENTNLEARQRLYKWALDKGDLARARTYLEELNWVIPFDLDVHLKLADIYQKTDRLDDEIEERRVAVALAPDTDTKARLYGALADAERRAGRIEDARFHLEEGLRLVPESDDLQKKLEEISSQ